MKQPLDGVRVLEWTTGVAGTDAGRLLGSLGAEVIKLEQKGRGDPFRVVKRFSGFIPIDHPNGRSLLFESFNLNKKGLALELKDERAREVLYRLIPHCDVFLLNFRREAAAGLGLDYPSLRRYNERLIYAQVSGFGPQGPKRDDPGYDLAAQAQAGAMTLMRSDEEPPFAPPGAADEMAAFCAAYGIITALLVRERTGQGQQIEASLLGGMLHLMNIPIAVKLVAKQDMPPFDRRRSPNPLINNYRCGDGKWLCLCMGSLADKYWPRMCQALAAPHLAQDPRFADSEGRQQHCEEIIAIMDDMFAQRPRDEWVRQLAQHDIVVAPVNTIAEVPQDPQVLANDYYLTWHHPALGDITSAGPVVKFGAFPPAIPTPAPELGQHNEELLSTLAGYSQQEIVSLRQQGVI